MNYPGPNANGSTSAVKADGDGLNASWSAHLDSGQGARVLLGRATVAWGLWQCMTRRCMRKVEAFFLQVWDSTLLATAASWSALDSCCLSPWLLLLLPVRYSNTSLGTPGTGYSHRLNSSLIPLKPTWVLRKCCHMFSPWRSAEQAALILCCLQFKSDFSVWSCTQRFAAGWLGAGWMRQYQRPRRKLYALLAVYEIIVLRTVPTYWKLSVINTTRNAYVIWVSLNLSYLR